VISLEDGWKVIQGVLDDLFAILESPDKHKTAFSGDEGKMLFSQAYTKCYNMCTQRTPDNYSDELYDRHGKTIENYLKANVSKALKEKRDEYLLKEMVTRWDQHVIMDKWMRKFFMYLDRYYVKHHSIPTLHEAGLEKFRTIVFDQVCSDFVTAILGQINKEREGEVVDRDLLKKSVAVFGNMSEKLRIYVEMLETPLLSNTEAYYKNKSQQWIDEDTLPVYLCKAEDALNTERERVDNYLETNTKSKLEGVIVKTLLYEHETDLLEKEGSGCRNLLQDEKKDDIARLFRLFSSVDGGLVPIAKILREHITKMGEEIVNKRETSMEKAASAKERDALDPAFIQSLLELHEKYLSLVQEQFQGHSLFQKALKEAFEVFVNHDVGKTSNAELISSFCDRVLKTGGAKLSDTQIESYLERSVQLFSYISDKDMFSEIYRNQLAKRLLMGRSASDDAERSMIAKLKLRCGAQFTAKIEGMVKDLLTGDEFKKKFKEYIRNEGPNLENTMKKEGKSIVISANASGDCVNLGGVDFSVDVLTTGHWPTYKQIEIALPQELTTCMEIYKMFYDIRTSHRCLKWVHSHGNAVVKATYKRPYDLQLTTLQAVTLLTFNGVSDWLSFTQIIERLNLEEEVAKRVMHSLSCAKHKVLVKDPQTKGISRNDKFMINEKFQSPMRKIRIPMASLDESHNQKRVQEDRSNAIEAAIVRIMKARKHMPHHQLVAEVLQQLHFFKPNPRVVKRRIEHLIDREYLERDAEQSNCYKYLA